jgi:glycerol-3-phosphate O-acyltransferase
MVASLNRLFDISGWFIPLARRVLYAWVRTTVFPEQVATLGLDPARPVCYVLQNRHLSNLLVLFEESRLAGMPPAEVSIRVGRLQSARSFFFLNRSRAVVSTARERNAHSPLLEGLVREAVADGALDVQLVPVVILWGRSPDKQESIVKALFSETWRAPGPLRQFLAILVHGRHVLVRFNPPISLRELLQGGLDEASAVRKLSRVLRVHFRRQRQMAIGPDLSHRNMQVDAVLESAPVRAAIAGEAARLEITATAAEQRARRFALEIASDYSYGVVRALELFLTWLWTRLYDGVELHNIEVVTRIAAGQGIVYVPCHRSHIDYLLLSWIIHRNGLTPPHIAAGANLNLLIIGSLLRRGGAFFLRRSFKGEPLYAAVFHEYLHLMIARGFPLEYFIEGGRSRSGRMLMPKAGILGMTVRSFVREHTRPLVFVPVYIGYEKIIEGSTYIGEMAGKPKQSESLWGVLQSLRKIKRVFGQVHVNFGEPLPLAGFLDQHRPGWAAEPADQTSDWLREATRCAAAELAARINEAAVLNPVNLIALTLLATPRHTADEHGLCRLLTHYQALVTAAPYSPATIPCLLDARQIISHGERLGIVERLAHPLGDLIRVTEGQAPLLAYFRNNVLHLFALPALIACLLSHNRRLDASRVMEAVTGIYGLMRAEFFLRRTLGELPAAIQSVLAVFVERGLLRRSAEFGRLAAPEASSQEFAELRLLGETMRPTLERHFLTLALLQRRGSGSLTRSALEDDCHLLAQRLSLLYEFNTPELSEKTMFAALIANLIEADLLHADETGRLHFDQRITTPLAHAELVLPAEVRQAIRRMAGEGAAS